MFSVAFSPDGKTIVSGSDDETIKVWDAGVSALTHPNPLSKPDCFCACGSFLELKAEKQSAHSGTICSVGFSPDGTTIVSGSADKTIKVWDAGASALTPSNP